MSKILKTIKFPKTNKNVCLALSGGLDSVVLLYALVQNYDADRVKCLSFDYNQRHSVELEYAKKHAEALGVYYKLVDISYLSSIVPEVSSLVKGSGLKVLSSDESFATEKNEVNTYVPWRNGQFAMIEASFAEANDCNYIFHATNAADVYGYFDCTLKFRNAMNKVFDLNPRHKIKLVTPFSKFKKEQIVKLGLELESIMNKDIIDKTWSCYAANNNKECGVCNSCTEKLKGFIKAKVDVPRILKMFNITREQFEEIRKELKNARES